MKIQQEQAQYKPITIKLEKQWEAEVFFSLVDKLSREAILHDRERELIMMLSDARTNMNIVI